MKSIIELAREAGLGSSLTHNGGEPRVWIEGADWHNELTRFAALVRAAALDEASGVCDAEAMRCEAAAQRAIEDGEHDEVSPIRSTAWKISVCAAAIRQLMSVPDGKETK